MSTVLWLMVLGLGGGVLQAWWTHGRPPRRVEVAAQRRAVSRVRALTSSVTQLELDGPLPFVPGQFVLVRAKPSLPWRAYSLSQAPGADVRLIIKRVEGGLASPTLTRELRAGDTLELKGPFGRFSPPADVQRLLFIAGGSGLTPFLSMCHAYEQRGWPVSVQLVNAHRNADEALAVDELDALAKRSAGRFTVVHALGPVFDARALAGIAADAVLCCGPEPLLRAVRAALPDVHLIEERFVVPAPQQGGGQHDAVFLDAGRPVRFAVRGDEAVLHAARREGVSLPSGCEQGSCGTCKVRVLHGTIETPLDSCLSPEERERGEALTCVGRAGSAEVSFEVC
jgi:ring-1,2-phenylacetyl-CoA epoxidase subunit PaaE